MSNRLWLAPAVLLALLSSASLAAGQNQPIPGIGPVGKVVKLHTNFKFTEGPAADRHGNVYFNDVRAATTYKVDKDGKLSKFRENTNNANGQMLNAHGEIVTCEMASGRVVAVSTADSSKVRVVTDKYDGKRYNAPNDLAIDKQGGVYFTDPDFGAPVPRPQDKLGVYYVAPDGKVTRLIDNLAKPNGVRLSPDEKTLYVFPSGSPKMMAYTVTAPGKIDAGRVFCTLRPKGKVAGGADGAAVDTRGNVYITSATGLQVYDSSGKYLGNIDIPEQPANVCFGGPKMNVLYVTVRSSLYTVPMEATGITPPAPKK